MRRRSRGPGCGGRGGRSPWRWSWALPSVQCSAEHREVLDAGAQRDGGEEGEAADDQDDADQEADEQPAVGREGAGRRGGPVLGGERAGDGERRDDDEEPADPHVDGAGQVVEGRVAGEAGDGRTVGDIYP